MNALRAGEELNRQVGAARLAFDGPSVGGAQHNSERRELLLDLVERRLAEVLNRQEFRFRPDGEFSKRDDAQPLQAFARPDGQLQIADRTLQLDGKISGRLHFGVTTGGSTAGTACPSESPR